ncbi:hypothetical protein M885DRAFT_611411 [Pelagophyceae sp. CCMP2097]|nr:hypothetical protein M885DRAFT_611411 [Pelagophyceae sp. CCMP2097]
MVSVPKARGSGWRDVAARPLASSAAQSGNSMRAVSVLASAAGACACARLAALVHDDTQTSLKAVRAYAAAFASLHGKFAGPLDALALISSDALRDCLEGAHAARSLRGVSVALLSFSAARALGSGAGPAAAASIAAALFVLHESVQGPMAATEHTAVFGMLAGCLVGAALLSMKRKPRAAPVGADDAPPKADFAPRRAEFRVAPQLAGGPVEAVTAAPLLKELCAVRCDGGEVSKCDGGEGSKALWREADEERPPRRKRRSPSGDLAPVAEESADRRDRCESNADRRDRCESNVSDSNIVELSLDSKADDVVFVDEYFVDDFGEASEDEAPAVDTDLTEAAHEPMTYDEIIQHSLRNAPPVRSQQYHADVAAAFNAHAEPHTSSAPAPCTPPRAANASKDLMTLDSRDFAFMASSSKAY